MPSLDDIRDHPKLKDKDEYEEKLKKYEQGDTRRLI